MLIECLLKRVGGSDIPFGQNVLRQVVYKFRPVDEKDNSSSHLCEVDNKDHIAFFLSLRPKVYVEYIVGQGAQFEDEDFENTANLTIFRLQLEMEKVAEKYDSKYM